MEGSVQLGLNSATHKTLSGSELFNCTTKNADKGSDSSAGASKNRAIPGAPAPDPKQVGAISNTSPQPLNSYATARKLGLVKQGG